MVEQLEEIQLKDDDVLVSFDMVGLFPSIPIDKLPTLLKKWLEDVGVNSKEIEEYIILTRLCIEQNFFSFNEIFYRQKCGLAMGSPLSPFLVNLYMSSIEIKITEAFPLMFKTWHRYVDDIMAIVPKKLLEDSLTLLNLQETSLKFTMEKENEKQLPFLHLKLMRKENKISFGIHRKPTHTQSII